ncbi:2-oxo-4-hydroxy-4-carboxy-5-ureidoimidazoline decarboxylase [Niveispirillum irakense]|uniref:2-oxo-4-hydroxy-4-carboxy-5-ureidoimidazoline decarboxylase n=1 Tax=Niveispirillum irakense TaxID=34011 RepID=UPI00041994FF|nr:2-oxo-4-hydroxy-4-carboxy-5-ureidoimidazoline decarboxylase [Niveispirillum irakense]
MEKPSLPLLNAMDRAAFTAALGMVFEDSSWVADGAWAARPFASVTALHNAMVAVVAQAGEDRQRALLCAHPDLAGKLARAGTLTAHSTAEQAGLGLDRLDEGEFAFFDHHNRAYRERFGFPFIIAVKENTKASIKEAMTRRLAQDAGQERETALGEVAKIAKYRLEAMLGS